MTIERIFLDHSVAKLRQDMTRIRDCVGRLDEEEIWARGHDTENAVGNLVLHLAGNARQWIVSSLGGAPDTRERDGEFAARGGMPAPELLRRLDTTIEEAVSVIAKLGPERLLERVTIQKYDVTVLEAVYHVVEHFAAHTGQIIFATKMLKGEDLGFYRHLNPPRTSKP